MNSEITDTTLLVIKIEKKVGNSAFAKEIAKVFTLGTSSYSFSLSKPQCFRKTKAAINGTRVGIAKNPNDDSDGERKNNSCESDGHEDVVVALGRPSEHHDIRNVISEGNVPRNHDHGVEQKREVEGAEQHLGLARLGRGTV